MSMENKVRKIIEQVKKDGDRALFTYTRKFDKFILEKNNLFLTQKEIRNGRNVAKAEIIAALEKAYNNIRIYHQRQFSAIKKRIQGNAGEKFVPIERICIYVPGGRFSYPSTVLMAAIPARVAGVKEIYLTTPARNITPEVLAATDLCRIGRIYRLGGVQAIAAFACGTESVPKVDKIVGPGNIYVTLAKKLLYGEVGIDLLAGPSEVIILADNSAKIEYLMNDLLAQAEHDPGAKALLLTREERLISGVKKAIPAKFRRQIKIRKIANLTEGIKYINQQAPEHLELVLKNAAKVSEKINNAGAIFIGNYSPVAIGDYLAGPSHILPTDRSARFSSGLSVYDFLKRISIINYNQKKFREDLPAALALAESEGMNYHYRSLKIRE